MRDQPEHPDLASSARRTLQRVREGMQSQQQLPLVGQLVGLIKEISGEAEKLSLDELVNAIRAEPTTLARVMAVASTMVYNPTGGEVVSLHQAVLAIGFEEIRRLAISILLLESAQSEFSAEANRELAGTAVVSGLIAAELGAGSLGIDPDQAFVCTALRNYGRMLAATFMAEDYASLNSEALVTNDAAFRSKFGLLPVELAHEILADCQLPSRILETLVSPSEPARKGMSQEHVSPLVLLAEFSHRFGELLARPDLTNENFTTRVEALKREYGGAFLTNAEALKNLLLDVEIALSSFSARSGLSNESVSAFWRLNCLAHSRPIPAVFSPKARTSGQLAAAATQSGKDLPPRDEPTIAAARSLGFCMDSVVRMVNEPHPDPRRIFELVLQTLHKTLGLTNCLVFVKHRQSGLFRVTRGVGPLMKFAHETVALDPTIPSIFSEAINKGTELFIADPNHPSVRNSIPEWLCPAGQETPFLLLPIKAEAQSFALICGTFSSRASFGIAERLRPELLLLRNQVSPVGDFLS